MGDGTVGSDIHILTPVDAVGLTSVGATVSRMKSRDYTPSPRVPVYHAREHTIPTPALSRKIRGPGGIGVRRRAMRLGARFTDR